MSDLLELLAKDPETSTSTLKKLVRKYDGIGVAILGNPNVRTSVELREAVARYGNIQTLNDLLTLFSDLRPSVCRVILEENETFRGVPTEPPLQDDFRTLHVRFARQGRLDMDLIEDYVELLRRMPDMPDGVTINSICKLCGRPDISVREIYELCKRSFNSLLQPYREAFIQYTDTPSEILDDITSVIQVTPWEAAAIAGHSNASPSTLQKLVENASSDRNIPTDRVLREVVDHPKVTSDILDKIIQKEDGTLTTKPEESSFEIPDPEEIGKGSRDTPPDTA